MNQRLTRKDIKRDEFANAVGRSFEFAESHSRQLLLTLGTVLLAVLVGILAFFYVNHRSDLANEALAKATKVYTAPIDPAGAKPNDPREPSFATAAARQARARQLFERLRSDYRFTDAARSEEHTSELQSTDHLVCRLLLEKKKQPPAPMRWSDDPRAHHLPRTLDR